MQYENAKDILPASLLEEVQKFAEGRLSTSPNAPNGKAGEKRPVIVEN